MVKANSQRAIAVIDYEEHTRGGHFGHWLAFFVREFARRFDRVLVCTPCPEKTALLFQSSPEPLPAGVSFPPIPVTSRKLFSRRRPKRRLDKVLRDAAKLAPSCRLSGFAMWGYDLLEKGVMDFQPGIPWGTLVTLSWEQRNYANDGSAHDRRMRELCQNRPDCAGMMTPDNFLVSPKLRKSLWIPATQDLRLPPDPLPEAAEVRRRAAGRTIVGATGLLTGSRCVNELLRLAAQHPELFFLLAGKLDRNSVSPDLRPALDSAKPENLLLVEGFLEETRLNAMIDLMDVVFIDGLNYPVHSSVVVKALHFGKFILTVESNSWTRDTIRQWGVGATFAGPGGDIRGKWRDWKNSGGPERAHHAASELMSPTALKACFDEMTQALTSAESPG